VRRLAGKRNPSKADQKSLEINQSRLCASLVTFRSQQYALYPSLKNHISAVDPMNPEKERLNLPSSFNQAFRSQLGLDELAKVEYALREGRAHDALEDVRLAIQAYNYNVGFKKLNVHGQGPNTRAQKILKDFNTQKIDAADKYRRTRIALLNLGLAPEDPALQDLRRDQLWAKDTSTAAKLGDTKKEDPWFWTIGRRSGLSQDELQEWAIESMSSIWIVTFPRLIFSPVDKVKYFRDRAARDRAREEKEILEEELRRTTKFHQVMQQTWLTLGNLRSSPGALAYAFKQASMFKRFAQDSERYKREMKFLGEKYNQWYEFPILYSICGIHVTFTRYLSFRNSSDDESSGTDSSDLDE